MDPNEPVKNFEPSMPEGMQRIDTSKLDPEKLKAMQEKLKNVGFSVGESKATYEDGLAIEGIPSDDAGAVRNTDPNKPRISFKQPKKAKPQRIE